MVLFTKTVDCAHCPAVVGSLPGIVCMHIYQTVFTGANCAGTLHEDCVVYFALNKVSFI